VNLTLSDEERTYLAELLDRNFRDLKEEINKTEAYAFKESLKAQERMLVGLLAKLGTRTVS
jgi:DNA polymerase III delta subunit